MDTSLDFKRPCTLDIFDYSGNKKCTIYDSSSDVSGQATNVFVKNGRNGSKEVSFTLPSTCYDEELGEIKNYRIDFLKADYRLRLVDEDGVDWFLISEPKVTHKAFSQDIDVTAGHINQLLKTKQMNLKFSDEEGNSVGTARELLTAVLDGTGWVVGEVDTFYEKDGVTEKHRTLNASEKTGATKLISMIADLFEAKPIYHGEGRVIDLVHMNPFSKKKGEYVPEEVENADGVLELHYGHNLTNVTRTINTENLVTSLYAYGSYGEVATSICNISEATHEDHNLVLKESLINGTEYCFQIKDKEGITRYRKFTPTENVSAGTVLSWCQLDPASMSYLWNKTTSRAYLISYGQTENMLDYTLNTTEHVNTLPHIMDFSYYQSVGLFDDNMLQAVANYQRNAPEYIKEAQDAAVEYSESQNELNTYVGTTPFCKLNITGCTSDGGYLKLIIDEGNRFIYHTQQEDVVNANKFFDWVKADKINGEGDAMSLSGLSRNPGATVVYIVHNTTPITIDRTYIKTFSNSEYLKEKFSNEITLWIPFSSSAYSSGDRVYLFEHLTDGGILGVCEEADFSCKQSAKSDAIDKTIQHPIFYQNAAPTITPITFNGFALWWKTYNSKLTPGELYLCYTDGGDSGWNRMYSQKDDPALSETVVNGSYWFSIDPSRFYRRQSGVWVEYKQIQETSLKNKIDQIFQTCFNRDVNRLGEYAEYKITITESKTAGNYYCPIDYDRIVTFSTNSSIQADDEISFLRTMKMFSIVRDGVQEVVTCQVYRLKDAYIHFDPEDPTVIVVGEDKKYYPLSQLEGTGRISGLIEAEHQFPTLADETYELYYVEKKRLENISEQFRRNTIITLGDLYREGYWQKQDYVDGDEDKLYNDAIENLEQISQPDVKYDIGYVDRYGSNKIREYFTGDYDNEFNLLAQKISPRTAVHLVDPEININEWAFIDEIKECKDQPWKSTISINTNLSTIAQHTFMDVITNIANVASEMKAKAGIYDRAENLGTKTMAAERLEGAIDAAKLKLFGTASVWETDNKGNIVFTAADGSSAMALTGNGFAIANQKDENGDWLWRTAGTGQGIVADTITTGYLSSDRIEAGSIVTNKLSSEVGRELDIEGNNTVIRLDQEIEMIASKPGTRTYIYPDDPRNHDDPTVPEGETPRKITPNYGDYWVQKTDDSFTWQTAKDMTVADLKQNYMWASTIGAVQHWCWDGTQWIEVNDVKRQAEMWSRISVNAAGITLESRRASAVEEELASSIRTTAESIDLKVEQGIDANSYRRVNQVGIDTGGVHIKASAESASSIDVTPQSIDIKSGAGINIESGGSVIINADGLFKVASANFNVDENGEVSIFASSIKTDQLYSMSKNDHESAVLTEDDLDIVVSDTQPEAKLGRIWIKPVAGGGGEDPVSIEVVYKHTMARDYRKNLVAGAREGAPYGNNSPYKEGNNTLLTGQSVSAISGATQYIYTLTFPAYISNGGVSGATLTAHLIAGANSWTATQTVSSNIPGAYRVVFDFNIDRWIGNLGSIRFWVETTGGNSDRYNVLNNDNSTIAELYMSCSK